ncbi:MAG: hypothetical protein DHS20C18_33550 [Saprospiraceae bacterium]|nr:MAG: hypothetical protein DHS20C18_33550 [Saprospiraceae bacterium]
MNKFITKIVGFSIVLFLVLTVGILLPATPRASKSLLFSKIQKDALLKNVEPPRIIFIGGSNLSFGLNSKMVKDSLGLNPVNTGIHASIGLIFMMNEALPYIRRGDIVVVAPEYDHFFGTFAYGKEELLRTIFDVDRSGYKNLKVRQVLNIIGFLPKYSLTKFNPLEYFDLDESDVYSVHSFNQYGDTYAHWGMQPQIFDAYKQITGDFNDAVVEELVQFRVALEGKRAKLFMTYPGLQRVSFQNSIDQINKVDEALKDKGFSILGTPERYIMEDSMLFNSPYHLTKKGLDYRTKLFIEDYKKGTNN